VCLRIADNGGQEIILFGSIFFRYFAGNCGVWGIFATPEISRDFVCGAIMGAGTENERAAIKIGAKIENSRLGLWTN
jgi:hypothetical protein